MKAFSVEVDKYNPTALTHCLKELEDTIPDYEWAWKIVINAGGIDYGIYLNIDVDRKEVEICNQSEGEEITLNDLELLFEDEDEDEEFEDDDEE